MGSEIQIEKRKPLRILRVEFFEISELRPHEELIEEEIETFLKSLKEKNLFYKPILVDRENLIILDGHHRVEGLRRIGAKRVPCILLSYLKDDEIQVFTWYPMIKGDRKKILYTLANTEGIKLKNMDREDALREVKSGKASFALVSKSYSAALCRDARLIIKTLESIEGVSFEFVDTLERVFSNLEKYEFALIRKKVKKEDIVRMGLSDEVFSPKTTRHYLPYRYQNIKVRPQELF
ncbi:MAG: ParB N-terminal domain-containing protein [Candidatus Methanofastidiosia archaeon]